MKSVIYLGALFILLTGCNRGKDPDPGEPEPILSYFTLYNFYTEPYDIKWEVNDKLVIAEHPFGIPVVSYTNLNSTSQNVPFTAKISGAGTVIESDEYRMDEEMYYAAGLVGTEEDPFIFFEPLDTDPPATGMVKIRFLHAVQGQAAVDIYIGGTAEEYKRISGMTYTDISNYIEVSTTDAWKSLVVTPYGMAPDPETNVLSFGDNETFEPDMVYLGVITHISSQPSSSVELLLYEQPVSY